MATLAFSLLVVVAALLVVPVAVFFVEIIAAVLLPQRQFTMRADYNIRRRIAVLVPAHNESTGIKTTLEDIQRQLLPGDTLLVVADNCTDDTAAIARVGGAKVIERHDLTKIGKGYALDLGLRHLALDPPEIVIMVDADCKVEAGAIDQLASTSAATGRPVQALHIMRSPSGSLVNHQVAEFAGRVKLWLRPRGLNALGLPCLLLGTGMAFPWGVIRSADLTNGSIVEDLKLGLELSEAGYPPIFCPSACVRSEFPSSARGTRIQRKRWEHGHISMILKDVPRLLFLAIARHNLGLLTLTLDLAVPPISLLGMLVFGIFVVSALSVLLGFSSTAFTISVVCLMVFMLCGLSCVAEVRARCPSGRRILVNCSLCDWEVRAL